MYTLICKCNYRGGRKKTKKKACVYVSMLFARTCVCRSMCVKEVIDDSWQRLSRCLLLCGVIG